MIYQVSYIRYVGHPHIQIACKRLFIRLRMKNGIIQKL